jgi:hypothetical protein
MTNIHITPLLALKIAQVYGDYLGNSGQLERSDLPAHYSWQYPDKSGLPYYI